jgi:uncharacterized membrane protein
MNRLLYVVPAIALTAICWGVYGPVLHRGQGAMAVPGDKMRPFLCVGIAYFVLAVIIPVLVLRGEVMHGWAFRGTVWSLSAGVAGALGALGIVIALSNGGSAAVVMPLVFGFAPVVNTFLTIYMSGRWNETSPMFFAGLILVVVGAVTVLMWAPKPAGKPGAHTAKPPVVEEAAKQPA